MLEEDCSGDKERHVSMIPTSRGIVINGLTHVVIYHSRDWYERKEGELEVEVKSTKSAISDFSAGSVGVADFSIAHTCINLPNLTYV